jgi:hypothetical protein
MSPLRYGSGIHCPYRSAVIGHYEVLLRVINRLCLPRSGIGVPMSRDVGTLSPITAARLAEAYAALKLGELH